MQVATRRQRNYALNDSVLFSNRRIPTREYIRGRHIPVCARKTKKYAASYSVNLGPANLPLEKCELTTLDRVIAAITTITSTAVRGASA